MKKIICPNCGCTEQRADRALAGRIVCARCSAPYSKYVKRSRNTNKGFNFLMLMFFIVIIILLLHS